MILGGVGIWLLFAGCSRPPTVLTGTPPPPKPVPKPIPIKPAKKVLSPLPDLSNWKISWKQVERADPKFKSVALTFDGDCFANATIPIVNSLKKRGIRATFFISGRFANVFPKECQALIDADMEIANHSHTHPYYQKISADAIRKEFEKSEAAIAKRFGRGTKPLFRFPYGESDVRSRKVTANLGFQSIYWSLDALDAFGEQKSGAFVKNRILNRVKAGDIVLMHVSSKGTADALPAILDELAQRGLKVVPVSQMLYEGSAILQP